MSPTHKRAGQSGFFRGQRGVPELSLPSPAPGEDQAGNETRLELEDGEDQTDALEVFARAFPAPPTAPEKQLQMAIIKLAEEELGLRVFWIPQSARTGIGRMAKTARGWPDLTIGSPRTGRMLHREVKSKYGEPSAEQQEWLWMLYKDGRDQGIWRPKDWESGRIRTELEALG